MTCVARFVCDNYRSAVHPAGAGYVDGATDVREYHDAVRDDLLHLPGHGAEAGL